MRRRPTTVAGRGAQMGQGAGRGSVGRVEAAVDVAPTVKTDARARLGLTLGVALRGFRGEVDDAELELLDRHPVSARRLFVDEVEPERLAPLVHEHIVAAPVALLRVREALRLELDRLLLPLTAVVLDDRDAIAVAKHLILQALDCRGAGAQELCQVVACCTGSEQCAPKIEGVTKGQGGHFCLLGGWKGVRSCLTTRACQRENIPKNDHFVNGRSVYLARFVRGISILQPQRP